MCVFVLGLHIGHYICETTRVTLSVAIATLIKESVDIELNKEELQHLEVIAPMGPNTGAHSPTP